MRFNKSICTVLLAFAPLGSALAADVVAKRTLRVGTIISAGDVHVRGAEDQSQATSMHGLELRRAVYAGHPVTRGHLGPPTLVQRNEIVAMNYRTGALGIRTEGRALNRGGQGEIVEVMNLSSRLTVRAVVTGPRQVEVQR